MLVHLYLCSLMLSFSFAICPIFTKTQNSMGNQLLQWFPHTLLLSVWCDCADWHVTYACSPTVHSSCNWCGCYLLPSSLNPQNPCITNINITASSPPVYLAISSFNQGLSEMKFSTLCTLVCRVGLCRLARIYVHPELFSQPFI